MKRSGARKPDAFKHQRNYAIELRIANGPWYLAGPVCESRKEAESIGAMLAKWWLGVAESRAVPLKRAGVESATPKASESERSESLFAQLAGF